MNDLPSLSDTPHAPGTDLLTFAFEGPYAINQTQPLYIDATDPSQSLNAAQLKSLVKRLIAGFKAIGLEQGDHVLVNLANNIFYSSIYFAVIGAGGIFVPINPANREHELNHYFDLIAPRFVITSHDVLDKVSPAASAQGIAPDHIYLLNPKTFTINDPLSWPPSPPRSEDCHSPCPESTEHRGLCELLEYGESDWIRFQDEQVAKTTPAATYSTSGTSGLPKAAILSHYAVVCQHLSAAPHPQYQIRRLLTLPFFHIFAAVFVHILPVRHGQPLYILPRFHLDQYVDCLEHFKITDTLMAPPMVHALNRSSRPIATLLQTIRYIGIGGAPIDADTMQQLQDTLHPTATLTQVWGMTEMGAATLHQHPEQGNLGSIGKPLPGFEMRLLSSSGELVLDDHQPGELQVRYPGMMLGYKNQTPLEPDSWYSTGDIMSRVEGRYLVVGRSKELIKVNGFQVSPAELEATLLTHDCIVDCAVIGTLRADGITEVPRAFVIRKCEPGGRCSSLSTEQVYNFAATRLASYKRLDGGIVFVDSIPRTASGKIQRFKLAQMDQYRQSITELLVKNDVLVKKEDVRELRAHPPKRDRRGSPRKRRASIGCGLVGEAGISKKVALPSRRRGITLRAKMQALEETSALANSDKAAVAGSV